MSRFDWRAATILSVGSGDEMIGAHHQEGSPQKFWYGVWLTGQGMFAVHMHFCIGGEPVRLGGGMGGCTPHPISVATRISAWCFLVCWSKGLHSGSTKMLNVAIRGAHRLYELVGFNRAKAYIA